MDKVHLVLLKKNGMPANEILYKEDGLKKFITAISFLLEANKPATKVGRWATGAEAPMEVA